MARKDGETLDEMFARHDREIDSQLGALAIFALAVCLLIIGIAVAIIYHVKFQRGDLVPVDSGWDTFRVTAIDPPKHFYVTLYNVDTKSDVGKHHVNKHCNAWQKLKIGSEWRFAYTVYEASISKERHYEVNLSKFCEEIGKL